MLAEKYFAKIKENEMKDCKYEVIEAVSKQGKTYYQLRIAFSNGYVFETFLNKEQLYIINLDFNSK